MNPSHKLARRVARSEVLAILAALVGLAGVAIACLALAAAHRAWLGAALAWAKASTVSM